MNEDPLDLNHLNSAFLGSLYGDYRRDPDSVPADWCALFRRCDVDAKSDGSPAVAGTGLPADPAGAAARTAALQDRVDQLVRAYRVRGHMVAQVDPLGLQRPEVRELDPACYGLGPTDLDRQVSCRTIAGPEAQTLRELLRRLQNTYCRSIGVQFMHIDDPYVRHWLQERMEGTENRLVLSRRQQYRILCRLTEAAVFEEFMRRKYIGSKTFSLEGSESLIPLLDLLIEGAGRQGVREIVIGMAHRGRLNVLANIMKKRLADILHEFEDDDPEASAGKGEVKYHLGYSSDWETAAGSKIHLSLCFNPSHLEFIDPVVLGRTRAKQDRAGDAQRQLGMALLIHGEAAFAGEGIVQETLNLSALAGYTVGGTVHIIINNQLGFTTPPAEGRSSDYATGVARMLQIPIFHVNGEDPEAVAQVVELAVDFRKEFRRDVVIDMYGYRRRGHSEIDDPSFTQPVMYQAIKQRPPVHESYLEQLVRLGQMTTPQAEQASAAWRTLLEKELAFARSDTYAPARDSPSALWAGYHGGPENSGDDADTGVRKAQLAHLLRRMLAVPEGFHRHPRLQRFVTAREEMAEDKQPLDWSATEALALASLALEGVRVRLSGQDSARGTFSQRHAVLYDCENGTPFAPLQHLSPHQAPVEILNSPLSEGGVLGFEYGYSLDCPDGLVLWEAQYGDFVNAAQVIIDQFITSGEEKWRRLSGIVLLLPHGFEGQGPEHSSARIERFLQLAAEHNVQIAQPSTPAQYFHVLRRQARRTWRKPLILFSPKSLLRHPQSVSSLDELARGRFRRVIEDGHSAPGMVRRILLCAGKLYHDLAAARTELQRQDLAIVRLEQFYPLPMDAIEAALARYADETPACWVQEEPENMGAWSYLRGQFGDRLLGRFPFAGVCRPESASPATGSASAHKKEQTVLLERALLSSSS